MINDPSTQSKQDNKNISDSENVPNKILLNKSELLQLIESPVVSKIRYEMKENRVYAHCLTADFITDKIAVLWDSTKKDFLIWNSLTGLYDENCKHLVEKLVYRINPKFNKYDMNEIISKIKLGTAISKEDYYSFDYKVLFNNGVYDIKTKELIPYSPEIIIFEKLKFDYDPASEPPEIFNFLNQALPDKKDQQLLFEYVGYLFHPDNIFQVGLLIYGETRSGKSTVAKIVEKLFLESQKHNVSLHNLTDNHFTSSLIVDKYVNFALDMDYKVLKNVGLIKTLIGDDIMYAEAKRKQGKRVHHRVKLFNICNSIPYVNPDEKAFFNKWIFLNFDNSLPEDKQDKLLHLKLTTNEELSGFFNIVIAHYESLMSKLKFCVVKTEQESKDEWLSNTDHISSFVINNLQHGSSKQYIRCSEIYEIYCLNSQEHNKIVLSDKALGKAIKRHFTNVYTNLQNDKYESYKVYRNLKLK